VVEENNDDDAPSVSMAVGIKCQGGGKSLGLIERLLGTIIISTSPNIHSSLMKPTPGTNYEEALKRLNS